MAKKKSKKKIENLGQKIIVWFLLFIMVASFLASIIVPLFY